MKFWVFLPLLVLATLFLQARGEACPGSSGCSTDNTCCSRFDGSTTCCPLPNAVCCPGGNTCCPSGETCSSDACYKGVLVWPMLRYSGPITATSKAIGSDETKQEVNSLESSGPEVSLEIVCPDGSQCGYNSTCCPVDFEYGCCPLPNAVCCPDQEHCCPEDTICSYDSSGCYRADVKMTSRGSSSRVTPSSSFERVKPQGKTSFKSNNFDPVELSARSRAFGKPVVCPDDSQCVTGATCCKMSTGGYGCCPMPNAVCCRDGKHCCQEGTKCGKHRCIGPNSSIFISLLA